MKKEVIIFGALATLVLASCTKAQKGALAGREYCNCSDKELITDRLKCKTDIVKKYKEDMKDMEFRDAFLKAQKNCD